MEVRRKGQHSAIRAGLLASGSFAGYNIGSGFATGIEGQQFFAAWGSPGAFAGLLTALLATAVVFIPVYLAGYENRSDEHYNVYEFYCGHTLGRIIQWYVYLSAFCVIVFMISGAGATIHQYFGLPKAIGTLLLGALCIVTSLLDLKKLMHVLSYTGAVMVAFVLCCTVYTRVVLGIAAPATLETAERYVAAGAMRRISLAGLSGPIICGVASAGVQVISSLPWVDTTGSLCEDRSTALWSGLCSGLVFYLAQGVVVYLNLICMDEIAGAEVPLLAVFQKYLPELAMLYSGIIVAAIFSTVSGRLYVISARFDGRKRKKKLGITAGLVAISAFLGTILPFSLIANILSTANGCLGIVVGAAVLLRTMRHGCTTKS